MGSDRIAVVDVGSNTILLLIVEQRGDELVRIRDECRFGRLGQGLDRSSVLSGEAIERSLAILREYSAEARELGADRMAAIGTQAVREADNRAAFLEPAQEILGVPVEVISGDREAALAFTAAVGAATELSQGELVVADVGGASTEIIAGRDGRMTDYCSLPLGCVRHTERHHTSDPPTAEQHAALDADVEGVLAGADLALPSGALLVGSGGTASTLAAVVLGLEEYDSDRVHGTRLAPQTVQRELERYLALTTEARRELPGMEPQRADVIAAGVAIYARLLRHLAAPELLISDRGVRWGLARELAGPAGPP